MHFFVHASVSRLTSDVMDVGQLHVQRERGGGVWRKESMLACMVILGKPRTGHTSASILM